MKPKYLKLHQKNVTYLTSCLRFKSRLRRAQRKCSTRSPGIASTTSRSSSWGPKLARLLGKASVNRARNMTMNCGGKGQLRIPLMVGATSRVATRRIRELRRECLQQCLDCQPEHIRAAEKAPASAGEASSPWAPEPGCCRPCGRISGCHGAPPIECRIHRQKVAPRAMKSKTGPKSRRQPFFDVVDASLAGWRLLRLSFGAREVEVGK